MDRTIPEATVARLPLYLRALSAMAAADPAATVSSEKLAELVGVNAAKVRKDLSFLGSYGTRGVGYEVRRLVFQMNHALGLTGEETFSISGISEGLAPGKTLSVQTDTGKSFAVKARLDTPQEVEYYLHGGILQYVLRQLAAPE